MNSASAGDASRHGAMQLCVVEAPGAPHLKRARCSLRPRPENDRWGGSKLARRAAWPGGCQRADRRHQHNRLLGFSTRPMETMHKRWRRRRRRGARTRSVDNGSGRRAAAALKAGRSVPMPHWSVTPCMTHRSIVAVLMCGLAHPARPPPPRWAAGLSTLACGWRNNLRACRRKAQPKSVLPGERAMPSKD